MLSLGVELCRGCYRQLSPPQMRKDPNESLSIKVAEETLVVETRREWDEKGRNFPYND